MYADGRDEFENGSWGCTYKKQKVTSHLTRIKLALTNHKPINLAYWLKYDQYSWLVQTTEFIQTPKDDIFFQ